MCKCHILMRHTQINIIWKDSGQNCVLSCTILLIKLWIFWMKKNDTHLTCFLKELTKWTEAVMIKNTAVESGNWTGVGTLYVWNSTMNSFVNHGALLKNQNKNNSF